MKKFLFFIFFTTILPHASYSEDGCIHHFDDLFDYQEQYLLERSVKLPSETKLFDAELNFVGFTPYSEDKVKKAVSLIKKVVTDKEFYHFVLNFTHNGKKQFHFNEGLSNKEIYQTIINAQEVLLPIKNHKMDLDLKLYYSPTNVVGRTRTDELRIYLNTRFFKIFTISEVAGNIFHEWLHKLGFKHEVESTPDRQYSVPYALGDMVVKLGQKYEPLLNQ